MDKDEINDIARKAAEKAVISERCKEKAYHIYEAHEYAHAASSSALKLDKASADRYLNLIRHELEAADLPREKLEELGQDLVDAAHWIKEKSIEAVYPLGRFLDKTKELMFQEVVDCECGEASTRQWGGNPGSEGEIVKMYCQRCGKEVPSPSSFRTPEGMRSFMISGLCQVCQDDDVEGGNSGKYVTITDPGKTTFIEGQIVSREAFDKENERVRKLGEKPATGKSPSEMNPHWTKEDDAAEDQTYMLPGKPTRDDVVVHAWQERDRIGIWVEDKRTNKSIAEWWDEDAKQMFEDGFFKPGIPHLSSEEPGHEFVESVLDYAEDIGILAK